MSASSETRIRVVEILEATTGGTRRHLFDLVTNIDRSRFDVSVICSTLRDPAFVNDIEIIRGLGISVINVPMRREISPVHDLVALWRILSHLRSQRPDVVHTHSSKAGFLGRIAARLAKVKLVVHSPHVFSFQMDGSNLARAFFFRLEQFAARLTDHLVCVSPTERSIAISCKLATDGSCTLVTNGVRSPDPDQCTINRRTKRSELGLNDDDLVIGAIGRFTRQKGFGHLLSAAKLLSDELPRARFVLIGNGELYRDIEQRIRDDGIANRCLAVNTTEDLSAYYPIFDIFLLTSLWEGMPYAMLEAMSTGSAIVAFSTGGVKDVIAHNSNGILVPPHSDTELASAISNLASDPQKRDDLGVAARRLIASDYTLGAMVRHIEEIYGRVL